MKFKLRDKVLYKGKKAIIVGNQGKSTCGEDLFMIEFEEDRKRETIREGELEIDKFAFHAVRGKDSGGCSCGAWATEFPNIHADYCWKKWN